MVEVDIPGACAGSEADAAITTTAGATLSVQVADCAPVAVAAPGGLAVVHAGWRGLEAGVLVRAAERLRTVAPGPQVAVVGLRPQRRHGARVADPQEMFLGARWRNC